MFFRIPVRTALLLLCMSWFLGTNNISLAQDRAGNTDLYGNGRGENSIAEPPPASSDKSTDLYDGVGRGDNSSPAGQPVSPDKEGDLYSRERRAKGVIQVINRPPNIQGLSGLMVMNSAFTRPAGTLAMGGSIMFEDSNKPDYSTIQAPITLTYGITDTIEAGIKTKYVSYDSTIPKTSESGLGDSEIAVKWRWKTHSATTPELAVGLAGIIPTGNDSKGLNDVKNWGAKLMVMATSETRIFANSFLGVYLEAQAVFLDTISKAQKAPEDRYYIFNAGVLLPISSNNRLQAMIEINDTQDKKPGKTTFVDGDSVGITPALRYVTDTLSFTAGAQFLSKDTKGYEDTIRWIGTCSYQF